MRSNPQWVWDMTTIETFMVRRHEYWIQPDIILIQLPSAS